MLLIAQPVFAIDYQKFFADHCVKCHGPKVQKSKLRLDSLGSPSSSVKANQTWDAIVEALETGDMPPRKEPRPDAENVKQLVSWIGGELARHSNPAPALRRMNRVEYENTVRDLLGIDTQLADLLPEDSSVQGFDNVAGGLDISSILLERYLEAADTAFSGVIRRIKPLPPATRRSVLMQNKNNVGSVKKKNGGVIEREGAFVDFTPGWPPARIDESHPIEDGVYRCRVAVFPHEPNDRTLVVALYVGPLFGPGQRRFIGMYDVKGDAKNPRIIEFTTFMNEGHTIHILPWVYPDHVTWRDKHEKRPGVAMAWAETHGPLDQSFPSKAQTKLFGTAKTITMAEGDGVYIRHRRGVRSHYVVSEKPRDDAERIIRDLIPRAFRRPVDDKLAQQFVDLTLGRLDHGNTFEQSVRAGVTAVLSSPHFLLLNKEKNADDYTIASRLSYFLWSSMPDDELIKLAAAGKLSDPKVRHAQVERMLKDPKIERFIENFTGQWLDLRDIEFTTPDKKLYPEYDEMLLRSMLAETHGFFRHILDHNLSVLSFVDSDFTVLNERLAKHYNIPNVRGHENFRVVKLPSDSIRGGVLTHASVLKVTANGTTTSPVLRGVWVLDNFLNQPAPPPPPGVPAVEPDIRGATSIRERLKLHREHESCNRCHVRIDPPGFALEEFDVIGGHRNWYRAVGEGIKRVSKKAYYGKGQDIDKGGQLHDGRPFADFQSFRRLLMDEPDTFTRSIATKLLIYGCGRPVTNADRNVVEAVVAAARKNKLGLRSMIHAVVESDLFLRP